MEKSVHTQAAIPDDVLVGLRQRCQDAPIFVKATEREWAWLVVAEGHKYRLDAMEEGIEFAGCWVVPPWVKIREPEAIPPKRIANPKQYADELLTKHSCDTLVNPKLEPRYAALPGHRRHR